MIIKQKKIITDEENEQKDKQEINRKTDDKQKSTHKQENEQQDKQLNDNQLTK